jgi:hypothetical protein
MGGITNAKGAKHGGPKLNNLNLGAKIEQL